MAHAKMLGLDNLSYNEELVSETMSPDFPRKLITIPAEQLTVYAYALSQYASIVAFQLNQFRVLAADAKRKLNTEKREAQVLYGIKGRSNDEVMAKLYEKEPSLKILEAEALEKEQFVTLTDHMPELIKEHINIIKKEIERRGFDRNLSRNNMNV